MSAALPVDLSAVPFSRRGSWFAVSRLDATGRPGIHLRTVRGGVERRELLRFDLGGPPSYEVHPGALTLTQGSTVVELVLSGPGRAFVRTTGGHVTLEFEVGDDYDVVVPESSSAWRFVDSGANRTYRLRLAHGTADLDTGWDGVTNTHARLVLNGPALLVVDEFGSSPPPDGDVDVDAAAASAEAEFARWQTVCGAAREPRFAEAVRLASFITWAALVPADGLLRRESMLMSKNWMTGVWSWDHCFNAMALWRDPDAAAGQLLTVFDHQDEHGALPDCIDDAAPIRTFVKPPIHGWTVSWLVDRDGLTDEVLADLYGPLGRWTDWWFAHRVYGTDGVPSYNHGNDSGWDNSTVFAQGVPVQSPDLLALLALQMSALARVAGRLGRGAEAHAWRERAAVTVEVLCREFWVDGRFTPRHTLSGAPIASDSLLTLMPLVLGDLLPRAQFEASVDRLVEGGYLTAVGPATEPPTSPHYRPDGYWRGPVWAPTTLLLVDGLRRGGRADLADDIAERFLQTCAAGGMAENFDALTGEGLRDRSMTWTASVFLTLATVRER